MFGGYQGIYRDPETGVYVGATEMRKDGQPSVIKAVATAERLSPVANP